MEIETLGGPDLDTPLLLIGTSLIFYRGLRSVLLPHAHTVVHTGGDGSSIIGQQYSWKPIFFAATTTMVVVVVVAAVLLLMLANRYSAVISVSGEHTQRKR